MQAANRVRRFLTILLALTLGVLGTSARAAYGQNDAKKPKDNENFTRVSFDTVDGVELKGFLYTPTGKDKKAVVMFLPNIKGADSSRSDGWDHFADVLQKEGYGVLRFDFRGQGDSKGVAKSFWDSAKNPHNRLIRGAGRTPESIDQKDFGPSYYPYLVNDIAAAKSYLDRSKDVNSSNLILIGAGEGAALGALWLDSECKRKQMVGETLLPDGRPDLGEAEVRNVACAVWLSISPRLTGASGANVSVRRWLLEAGAENKLPMAFFYGSKNPDDKAFSNNSVSAMKQTAKTRLDLTAEAGVDTSLQGSKLLDKKLDAETKILSYLEKVMDKRGVREAKGAMSENAVYYWSFANGRDNVPAKYKNEPMLHLIPLQRLGIGVIQ